MSACDVNFASSKQRSGGCLIFDSSTCRVVVLAVLSIAVLTIALASRGLGPKKTYSQFGQDQWVLRHSHRSRGHAELKFLDIGSNDGEYFSNTKLLENNGWHGVCADPFPRNFAGRTCKLQSSPIDQHGGGQVELKDCSEDWWNGEWLGHSGVSGISKYLNRKKAEASECPSVVKESVGVVELVKLLDFPPVIDYVNLDTEGSELNILQGFPFNRTCVRLWTIEHNNEEPKKTKIQELMERHGCTLQDVSVDFWATCDCHSSSPQLVGRGRTSILRRHHSDLAPDD